MSEPVVETLTVRPLRSSSVFTGPSLATTIMMVRGRSASAATAIIGAPLTSKAMVGPPPSAKSMALAETACTSRASPPKLAISRSMPCFLKMPAATPTSAARKAKFCAWALPTRIATWACAATPQAMTTSAAASERHAGYQTFLRHRHSFPQLPARPCADRHALDHICVCRQDLLLVGLFSQAVVSRTRKI